MVERQLVAHLQRLVRMRPPAGLTLALFLTALVVGCGASNPLGRKAIHGNVKFNGAPLAKGALELHPLDGGVQAGGLIAGGSYSIAASDGPTPGKYRVVIYDTYDSPPLPPGHMPGDDTPATPKPKIPADWNSNSQQTIEVKKDGPSKFDFDIPAKKS
jgi:hypothetical protein